MRSFLPISLLAWLNTPVYGVILPFYVRFKDEPSTLQRRGPSAIPISNTGNAQYLSNITVSGVQLPVLLDTGSSDLWVNFPGTTPTSLTDTGKSLTLSYAVGKASGNVHTTTVQFADYSIDNQAFLLVTNTSTFTSDIHAQGYAGLLGLGPNSGSQIQKTLGSGPGDSAITRIFEQNKTTDNYISFILDRKNDPGATVSGQFAISEPIPGFENITSMPKLDVDTVNKLLKADQHWQALTDKDTGIIGPDGQPIMIKSIVPFAPDGVYVAVIDSGFTFSQVPRQISDAIYGRVQGAYFDSTNQYWMIPCGQILNLTFMFGGVAYPVHPLDVVDDNFNKVDATGKKVCIGAFQPITSAFSLLGHYDMILGMSFLRNAYTLLDFGDWTDATSSDTGHPFIQMAPMTNIAAARQDFINVRLGGSDTTGDPRWALLPANQTQHSPVSAEEQKKLYQEMILSRWPYILVGCLVFVILVVGLCVWKCCCRKGKKPPKSKSKSKKDLFSNEIESSAYLPLSEQQSRQQSTTSLPEVDYRASHSSRSYPNETQTQLAYPPHPPAYGEYENGRGHQFV